MSRSEYRDQLAALKRENRQLRQELEDRKARRPELPVVSEDPERDLHAIAEMLDQFSSTIEDQWGDRSRELSAHVDRLASEVADLRSEVIEARKAVSQDRTDGNGAGHRVILQPVERQEQEIVIEQQVDGVWRRIRRPWFYLPLVWGMILLAVALVYFWSLAS